MQVKAPADSGSGHPCFPPPTRLSSRGGWGRGSLQPSLEGHESPTGVHRHDPVTRPPPRPSPWGLGFHILNWGHWGEDTNVVSLTKTETRKDGDPERPALMETDRDRREGQRSPTGPHGGAGAGPGSL